MENAHPVKLMCEHQGEEAEDTAGEHTTRHSLVLLLLSAQQRSNSSHCSVSYAAAFAAYGS